MRNITKEEILAALDYPSLVGHLRKAFQADYTVPMRHHHDFENPQEGRESTLLLMPAWEAGGYLGVKVVTVSPNNGKYDLPAIQGVYLLFDAHKGTPIAQMEAKTLTTRRTAAASALASSYLSREDSKRLLMVGTGALAPELIRAHAAVRPIEEVVVWGRTTEKAQALVERLSDELPELRMKACSSIEEEVPKVDIVSCATLSKTALIKGQWLQEGQHVDLVGAYRPDMRESDDQAVLRSKVYVDTFAGGKKEGGDLFIPLQEGVITPEHVKGDLFALARQTVEGRSSEREITYFKSVGHALEDLAAAQLVADRYVEKV